MNKISGWKLGVGMWAAMMLAGCGDSGGTATTNTSADSSKASFQIGLIVSGSTADGGWNQLAWEGVQKLQDTMGAKVSKLEKIDASKAQGEMRDYANRGVDLVIGHGYEFADPAVEAAKAAASGKTKFVVSGYPEAKPGIMTLNFDLSQACYQLGIIAAHVTKSGKLGFIGGQKIPSLVACYNGFTAGAKSVRADVSVTEAYTSWDRPELSKSQSEAFFQQKVDVILQNVDAASRGVFEAVKERNAVIKGEGKGESLCGYLERMGSQNGNSVCPDYTLASAIIKLDEAFGRVATAVKDGSFKEGVVEENLANGVCVTVLNPKLVEKRGDYEGMAGGAGGGGEEAGGGGD